jgi:hypothetical protein
VTPQCCSPQACSPSTSALYEPASLSTPGKDAHCHSGRGKYPANFQDALARNFCRICHYLLLLRSQVPTPTFNMHFPACELFCENPYDRSIKSVILPAAAKEYLKNMEHIKICSIWRHLTFPVISMLRTVTLAGDAGGRFAPRLRRSATHLGVSTRIRKLSPLLRVEALSCTGH